MFIYIYAYTCILMYVEVQIHPQTNTSSKFIGLLDVVRNIIHIFFSVVLSTQDQQLTSLAQGSYDFVKDVPTVIYWF